MTTSKTKKRTKRPLERLVSRRVKTLRGYIVPAFIWDHNDPPRMFLPTLTKEAVNPCDMECIITVRWKAANESS